MRHVSPLPLGVGALLLRVSFFDSVVSAIDSLVRERARFLTLQARRDNGTSAANTRDLRGGERTLARLQGRGGRHGRTGRGGPGRRGELDSRGYRGGSRASRPSVGLARRGGRRGTQAGARRFPAVAAR